LWGEIKTRYESHSGFLVEALAEATPQCLLQLVAVVLTQRASALTIGSIILSVLVIASKGWLLSFSMHRKTFIFNALCIAMDCFGLFASVAWICSVLSTASCDAHDSSFECSPYRVALGYTLLICVCVVLGCATLLTTTIFAIVDDHLKLRCTLAQQREHGQLEFWLNENQTIWFDLYMLRLLSACLAALPLTVLYLGAKLTLVPTLLFRSLDPEHAVHASFYRPYSSSSQRMLPRTALRQSVRWSAIAVSRPAMRFLLS